jgi:hypothetical protein
MLDFVGVKDSTVGRSGWGSSRNAASKPGPEVSGGRIDQDVEQSRRLQR